MLCGPRLGDVSKLEFTNALPGSMAWLIAGLAPRRSGPGVIRSDPYSQLERPVVHYGPRSPTPEIDTLNTKVSDLMVEQVLTAAPTESVANAREIMKKERIQAIPIVDSSEELVGIVSAADLVQVVDGSMALRRVMTRSPSTIPAYEDISAAARLMRKRHIHHLAVTHEKKIVGIISSFDLLSLVEEHRFAMKQAPTPKKKARREG